MPLYPRPFNEEAFWSFSVSFACRLGGKKRVAVHGNFVLIVMLKTAALGRYESLLIEFGIFVASRIRE